MYIGVFCSSQPVTQEYLDLAKELGQQIAKSKNNLIWGGGKASMMGEVAKACIAAGGEAIGFIPEILVAKEQAANFATKLHITKTLSERKMMMIDNSQAFIIMPGGIGTLEEFSQVWTSAYVGEHTKTIVVLNYKGFYSKFLSWIQEISSKGFIPADSTNKILVATTPQEAIMACQK